MVEYLIFTFQIKKHPLFLSNYLFTYISSMYYFIFILNKTKKRTAVKQ